MQASHHTTAHSPIVRTPDFHGAAVIDEQGREIPITEAMIQNALLKAVDEPPLEKIRFPQSAG